MLSTSRAIFAICLSWAYLAIYSSLYVLFTIFTLGAFRKSTFHIAAHGWGRIPLILAGIKLETENLELLSDNRGKIVIFNHQSMLDLFWLSSTFPARGVAIIKKEFAYIPFINIALWSGGFLFIDRKNSQKSITEINKIASRVKTDKLCMYVAPEGTRTSDGQVLPFKKGAFHIAIQQQIPIYPLVVSGAYDLLSKNEVIPRSGTIKLKCLDPIDTSSWTGDNLSENIKITRQKMIDAIDYLNQD